MLRQQPSGPLSGTGAWGRLEDSSGVPESAHSATHSLQTFPEDGHRQKGLGCTRRRQCPAMGPGAPRLPAFGPNAVQYVLSSPFPRPSSPRPLPGDSTISWNNLSPCMCFKADGTEDHILSGLKQQKFIFSAPGGQTTQIKLLAGLVPFGNPDR